MGTDSAFGEPFYGTEKCVSCGKVTEYNKTDHIDLRKNYVEGVGQLCPGCYNKIYKK